jgi:hypothetical protein
MYSCNHVVCELWWIVASVRDATLGLDTGEADGKARLPATPDSQMITFRFVNGTTTTLRTSGTEPKLKYYVECWYIHSLPYMVTPFIHSRFCC